MIHIIKLVGFCCILIAVSIKAELEIYKSYDLSREVIAMTTVRIDPNMEGVYLAGLKKVR